MFVGGIKPIGYKPPIKKYERVLPTKNLRYTPTGTYKRLWDNVVQVGEIDTFDTTKYVIEIVVRDGTKHLNIRKWYWSKTDEIWYPTRKGIRFPLFVNYRGEPVRPLEDLPGLIQEAFDMYEDVAIFDPDKQVWLPRKEYK